MFKKVLNSPSYLHNEVVLTTPGLPRDVLVKHLSTALHADLSGSEVDGWQIVRTSATKRALVNAELKSLRSQIAETVSRVRKPGDGLLGNPTEWVNRALSAARKEYSQGDRSGLDTSAMQAQEMSPVSQLALKLLEGLSDTQLAKISPGRLTDFCNTPSSWEQPLLNWQRPFDAYLRDQAQFVAWTDKAIAGGKIEERDNWLFPRGPFVPGPRTLRLTINRRELETAFSLAVYDSQGRKEASTLLYVHGFAGIGKTNTPASHALGFFALPNGITYSSNEDLLAKDPLDRFVRPVLCGLAKAKGYRSVVGCIPDDLFSAVLKCIKDGHADLDSVQLALDRIGCEEIVSGNTLIIRPKLPLQEEATRMDRAPLAMLSRGLKRGSVTFDELCDYHQAYASNHDWNPMIRHLEKEVVGPNGEGQVPGWTLPHPLLALLGELSLANRQRLASGNHLPLAPANPSDGLYAFGEYLATLREPGSTDDLGSEPTRIFATATGVRLAEGMQDCTLVKRVSKGVGKRTFFDEESHQFRAEEGMNLVLDSNFLPIATFAEDTADLDSKYRFLWQRQRLVTINVLLGSGKIGGTYAFRIPLETSSAAVSVREVPGLGPVPKV